MGKNRRAAHLSQSLMRTQGVYQTGESSVTYKQDHDQGLRSFLRSNCLGAINRNTWLFLAEKFGRFLSWNELVCTKQGIFFGVVGNLRGDAEGTNGKVLKQYWFFEVCVGSPNICSVQVYSADGEKVKGVDGGKMTIFADSCGNVTNKKMDLFMSWKTFTSMPPLPLKDVPT
jgi:hypothetical protein